MTIYADKGMSISTVIVMAAVGYVFFQPVGQEHGRTTKMVRDAFASMASVAKCLLVRALALPETLQK
jgi:hypothetical protein